MPHCLAKDDIYNGYRIPAGASILNNVHESQTCNFDVRLLGILGMDYQQ
jgi:hypothetical protein